MDVLPVHFRTFQIFGLWYEDFWKFWPLKLAHRSFVLFLMIQFAFFQLLTLVMMRDAGVEAFIGCLFLTFTYVAASFKLIHFLSDRENIDDLLNKFRMKICQAQCATESAILHKYRGIAVHVFTVRMITTHASGIAFLFNGLILSGDKVLTLPINAYEIFNITATGPFVFAYAVQIMTTVCCISTDVCMDSAACAFMILICGQLELLSYRIIHNENVENEMGVRDYINHHSLIYIITHKLQSSFISVILPSFCSGLITMCSTIYQLAQHGNGFFDYLGFFLYLSFLLIQLYYFCWYGNELQIKCETVTDAIFKSNWISLKLKERRNYWLIMFMGKRELLISYHGQCPLNLRTFVWMLKTSYGAFNLLQQVSDKEE